MLASSQQFTGSEDSIQEHFYIHSIFGPKLTKEQICRKRILYGRKSGNDKLSGN